MIIGNPITLGGGSGGGGTLINKTGTENRVYDPADDGADGYKKFTVALPLGTKNISANGTYPASRDNLAAYSTIVVNVPQTISGGRCPRSEQTASFQYGTLLSIMSWSGTARGQSA